MKPSQQPRSPELEALEERWVPSTISGYVYNDVNTNGVQDNNEAGLAGVTVTLYNAQDQAIATTTTNANGLYEFTHDPTIPTDNQTAVQEVAFSGTTDYSQNGTFNQFDPALGTLKSVEVMYEGGMQTHFKAESLDAAAQTVTSSVTGTMKLEVGSVGSLQVGVKVDQSKDLSAYDGNSDFGGTSGFDAGVKNAAETRSMKMTAGADDLSAFIGKGQLGLKQTATADSQTTGSGNLLTLLQTTATGKAKIVYTYSPPVTLKPGNYIVREVTPPNYSDGFENQNNVKIPGTVGTDILRVNLPAVGGNSTNNNFGEVQEASIAGFVYHDRDNDGNREGGEVGLAGVTIRAMGTDFAGRAVDMVTTTAADGSYRFENLQPGTYAIGQLSQPGGFIVGLSTAGNFGGAASQNQILSIKLNGNNHGVEYNFGHYKPGSVAGYVYHDVNNNGLREAGETGLGGSLIVLNGQSYSGVPVYQTLYSAADGSYKFDNLLPGVYSIIQLTQPTGYNDGKDTVGSQGGIASNERIDQAEVLSDEHGLENNFGELVKPATQPPGQNPTPDPIVTPPVDTGHDTTPFSKYWFIMR